MKKFKNLLIVMVFLMGGISVSAQSMQLSNSGGKPHKAQGRFAYLNLTEEQQQQFQDLMAEMQKKMNPISAIIKDKNDELTKLMLTDNPDEKAIFSKIEEIGMQRIELQKIGVSNRIKFRSLLTDAQKEKYDKHEINKTKKAIKPGQRKKMN